MKGVTKIERIDTASSIQKIDDSFMTDNMFAVQAQKTMKNENFQPGKILPCIACCKGQESCIFCHGTNKLNLEFENML